MTNWKIVLGGILIFGASSELFRIINDYRTGVLEYWPFGADIGAILLILGGGWLVKSGLKNKSNI